MITNVRFTRGDRMADPSEKYRASGAREITESFSGDNRDQRSMLLWCSLWLTEAHRVLRDGSVAVVATDWRQLPTVCDALQIAGGFDGAVAARTGQLTIGGPR